MSLFGSLMGDVEDDPFFGSHMRTMRQMNNMMNSLFSDPFGMMGGMGAMGGSPLAIGGPRHGSSLMPFMPQMPSFDRLFSGDMEGMGAASSFSSSTVVMSNGPGGKPQIYSSSSSTKVGPNGIKETRKTLQDSRTGTKKMSIGHHIGERAHVIEREQNVYSGDNEERQEFINIEEEEADDFDREFQVKAGHALNSRGPRAIHAAPHAAHAAHAAHALRRNDALLALPPAPSTASLTEERALREPRARPTPRRPLRGPASPPIRTSSGEITATPVKLSPPPKRQQLAIEIPLPSSGSGNIRETYSGSHPQRHRHKHHKSHRQHDN
ncbi:hypothetical protein O0L34_g62 [Tuta absoluta]|nr:hypothetical protein O0L34_g62 [Tuta absoluta]